MNDAAPLPLCTPTPVRQTRSRRSRDALLAAGWRLLADRPWEEITIAELVTAAGASVGSFYARFTNKDAFFEVLAGEWLERATAHRAELFARLRPQDDFLALVMRDTWHRLFEHQHFWRAALLRGARDPRFWRPFRDAGLAVIDAVLSLRQRQLGRPLTDQETLHLRFAFQMANGLINNSLVNRPGPVMPGTPEFEAELLRGLKAVAGT